ncbi:MAG: sugar phosphate nucleotidyltransferase, partial [Candidatus Woesearchaeota archaeon]|nr:sugar phosphate nucleotidyltransferase [Candidatus Woesearchaeota archaeon]
MGYLSEDTTIYIGKQKPKILKIIKSILKTNPSEKVIYGYWKIINKNKKNLNNLNIFIFGIKPTNPSSEYGYFLTKNIKKNINKVTKFIEKPKQSKAKLIIKKKGYWNSGMFFLRKNSIINNFKKYQAKTFKSCLEAVNKAKIKNNTYYLNKISFEKSVEKSF